MSEQDTTLESADETQDVATEETVESTDAEATETTEETGEVAEEDAKPKKTAQDRINEITRARREAEREAAYWRKVALEKEQAEAPAPKPEPVQLPKRPTLDQFDSQEQYEDALFDWRDRTVEVKRETETRQKHLADAERTFNDRADALRAQHDDFDEVINNPVFSPAMQIAILNAEGGPDVAYHLGKPENWAVAERIRSLPSEMQLYEIGKLETKLAIAKTTKKTTTAPAPLKPVGATGSASKDPDKMTTAEWMAWDKERSLEKIKRRLGG